MSLRSLFFLLTVDFEKSEMSGAEKSDYYDKWLNLRFNIFEPLNVWWGHRQNAHSVASVLHLGQCTAMDAMSMQRASFLENWLVLQNEGRSVPLLVRDLNADSLLGGRDLIQTWPERLYGSMHLLKSVRKGFVPAVRAPPFCLYDILEPRWMRHLLFGTNANAATEDKRLSLFWPWFRCFGAAPQSQMYALAKSLIDSGKMLKLDELLKQLKAGGHRVLLFSQMTMMMNILEDYLSFRRYRYQQLHQ